ncbi:hypothetical protein ACFWIA_12565 [Streptomyces sp. NPDC127068]|uniref:hypothetical protein n=1 Tax=Streptomyces sp. NPDC127068 TaxID=3347127 RepID=UPI003664BF28
MDRGAERGLKTMYELGGKGSVEAFVASFSSDPAPTGARTVDHGDRCHQPVPGGGERIAPVPPGRPGAGGGPRDVVVGGAGISFSHIVRILRRAAANAGVPRCLSAVRSAQGTETVFPHPSGPSTDHVAASPNGPGEQP